MSVVACLSAALGLSVLAFGGVGAKSASDIAYAREFKIGSYGATTNGGLCTAAIASAMQAAETAGGGRVVVPAGRWMTGPVRFRSNCELHLAKGAELLFTDDLDAYLPGVQVSWEGIECYNVSPLVYAFGCTNVAITGSGTLKAKPDFWWTWAGPRKPDCEVVNRLLKDEWSPRNVPIAERQLWREPNARFRPQFLHFNRCRDVRLEGFAIRGSPFWTIHLMLCDGVAVRDLDVDATCDDGRIINNTEGIDIEATRNVLVERCTFCQGDDAVVLKSGKDFDGRRLATPTENVVVRDCTIRRAHNLAAVGSELSGGVRNVTISNCRILGPVSELLHVKTNPRRGGFVRNITLENIEADELRERVFGLTSRNYFGAPGEEAFERDYLTPIRDIAIRNVRCRKTRRRLDIRGDYLIPVENVSLENVTVGQVLDADYVANVRNLRINGRAVPATASPAMAQDLGDVDFGKAVWHAETREYVMAFTDGTVRGTVVRRSRDRELWSDPLPAFLPSDWNAAEYDSASLRLPVIRRTAKGWYLDAVFSDGPRTYYTPQICWPFRPKSCFKDEGCRVRRRHSRDGS